MEQLILEYNNKIDHYWPQKQIGNGIMHLAFFLIDDVGCRGINNWKTFIQDPSRKWTGSNYSSLEKENDSILIGFAPDQNLENPEVFITNETELNYILDRWQEACEKKPKRIIITRDNGKVSVDFED